MTQAHRQQHSLQRAHSGEKQPGQRGGRSQVEDLLLQRSAGGGQVAAQGDGAAEDDHHHQGGHGLGSAGQGGGYAGGGTAQAQHQGDGEQKAHALFGTLGSGGEQGVFQPVAVAAIHAAQP